MGPVSCGLSFFFFPYCERKDEELGYILRVSDFSCLIYGKGKEEAAIKRGRDHNLQQREQLRGSSCSGRIGGEGRIGELDTRGALVMCHCAGRYSGL